MLAVTIGDCQRAAQTKARLQSCNCAGPSTDGGLDPPFQGEDARTNLADKKSAHPGGNARSGSTFSHGDTRMAPDGFRVACTLPCRVDVRVDGARMHAPISNGNRHLRVRMLVALAASMPGGPNVWN